MRNVSERLLDIQESIDRILKYTHEGRYRYDHDELVQTWVTHNLYIIGEATRAIASEFPDFKDQHPEIKWTEIIGMRTILAHRYFEIDPDALWEAVNQELQDLKSTIDAICDFSHSLSAAGGKVCPQKHRFTLVEAGPKTRD